MKKFMLIGVVLLVVSLPLHALGPSFGIKGGFDKQSFEDLPLFIKTLPPLDCNDSLSKGWASFGAIVELNIPLMPIGLRGEANYAWSSAMDTTASDMNAIISAKFIVSPPLSPIGFYLGAGPSLHILNWGSESKNCFGAQIYTGLNLKMGLNLFLEGGYGIMFPEEGSWSQLSLKLGMML